MVIVFREGMKGALIRGGITVMAICKGIVFIDSQI